MPETEQHEKANSCQESGVQTFPPPVSKITERPLPFQEALQSDIFCLKRRLSLIAGENQLLKVKIRRLENELRRKDKYIESFQSDPQKVTRSVDSRSSKTIVYSLPGCRIARSGDFFTTVEPA